MSSQEFEGLGGRSADEGRGADRADGAHGADEQSSSRAGGSGGADSGRDGGGVGGRSGDGSEGSGGRGGGGRGDEVAGYAAEVRAQFADLPAAESAELLEDLEDHLREVAAEGAGTLRQRLGAPAVYARELRQAAGLPEPGEGNGSGGTKSAGVAMSWSHVLRTSVRNLVAESERRIRANPAGAAVLDFLPSLRPAWWVVRAWAVVRVLQVMTTNVDIWQNFSLIPRVGYSTLIGTLSLLAAIPASVYLGRRNYEGGWPRRLMLVGHGALVVFTVGMALSAVHNENDDGNTAAWNNASAQVQAPPPQGLNESGKPITNLYVYDESGKQLAGVLVYDQDGQPVTAAPGADGNGNSQADGQAWFDARGQLVPNAYPQQLLRQQFGDDGSHFVMVPPPAVTVPQGGLNHQPGPGTPQDSATPSGPTSPTSPTSLASPTSPTSPINLAGPTTPTSPAPPTS
ncbi:HAAS signaling domain-containing protein, partial [Catenulispora pinisilvae]|uniref:HAAS signaling domain-containing protein n=1 Tax=Catenulispora pinisilvae TaxID=2705253 RepID=UPI0018923C80